MSRSTSPGPEVQGQVQKSKSNKFSSAGRDEVQKSKSPEVQIPGLQRSRSPSPIKNPRALVLQVQKQKSRSPGFSSPEVQEFWIATPLNHCNDPNRRQSGANQHCFRIVYEVTVFQYGPWGGDPILQHGLETCTSGLASQSPPPFVGQIGPKSAGG